MTSLSKKLINRENEEILIEQQDRDIEGEHEEEHA